MEDQGLTYKELPEVSDELIRFASEIVKGRSAAEAFRRTWPERAGSMSADVLYAASSRLRHEEATRLWIDRLRQDAMESVKMDMDAYCARLEEVYAASMNARQFSSAVKAIECLGRVKGFYIERHADVTEQVNPLRALDRLADKYGEEIALKVAQKHDLDWTPPSKLIDHAPASEEAH